jgi:hypothetical protein
MGELILRSPLVGANPAAVREGSDHPA